MAHQLEVPDLAYARVELDRFESLIDELGRPAAVLMMIDRVLPPASAAVRDLYRQSAERTPIAVWAAVVGGVMGFAASIATSIAVQVFANRPLPMRVFRTVPSSIQWMSQLADLGATPAEVLAAAETLRNSAPAHEIRRVG